MENFKLNRSDYTLIGGYLFIVTFWLIFKFWVESYHLHEYAIDIPVAIIQIIILLAAAKWLIEFYFIKKGSLIIFISLSFFTLWLVSFLTMISGDFTRYGRIPWENYIPFTETVIFNVHNSIYNIAIPLMLISGKKYYEHQLVVTQLINSKKEIELKLLQSQFDPHFLYNSLNTIDALIDYSSKENIKKYVANLAELYRHRVMVKDEDVVSLDQEIALGKNYLFLIQTRFNNDYQVTFFDKSFPSGKYLPNGAFLSVIENVIKHNKPINLKPIEISIKLQDNCICVKNQKSLVPKNLVNTTESGLRNLSKRYQILNDQQFNIIETEDYFQICLPLLTMNQNTKK